MRGGLRYGLEHLEMQHLVLKIRRDHMFGTNDSQILSPLKISLKDRCCHCIFSASISKAAKLPGPAGCRLQMCLWREQQWSGTRPL